MILECKICAYRAKNLIVTIIVQVSKNASFSAFAYQMGLSYVNKHNGEVFHNLVLKKYPNQEFLMQVRNFSNFWAFDGVMWSNGAEFARICSPYSVGCKHQVKMVTMQRNPYLSNSRDY